MIIPILHLFNFLHAIARCDTTDKFIHLSLEADEWCDDLELVELFKEKMAELDYYWKDFPRELKDIGEGLMELLEIFEEINCRTYCNQEFHTLNHCFAGIASYIAMNTENAKSHLKQSIVCFENIFEGLHEDKNQISMVEGYILAYKLLSKIQVQMDDKKEALLTLDHCRAKALKYQLSLKHRNTGYESNQETNIHKLALLVAKKGCAILFYSLTSSLNDLHIFLVQNTKGENIIEIECHELKLNFRSRRALGLEQTTHDKGIIKNGKQDEDEEKALDATRHQGYCCGTRAGPPTENDDQCGYDEAGQCQQDGGNLNLFQRLHEKLLTPVLSKITANEIVVIPEGQLYSVPFAALQDPITNRYLSEDKRLRFSPSISNLLIKESVPDDYYIDSGSLIIGNPSIEGIENLQDLPGSQEEAEIIARIIGGDDPLIGSAATKSAILDRLSQVSIIHFACHINLTPSAIVLAPEGVHSDENYLLKPEDVMEKDVHARLVVLSGCDSGRGKISAEGVEGIARAFLAAGAAAVLVSLWRVGDHSTCEFMTTFYRYLLDRNMSASESLHLTINDKRRKYEGEPKKWSGFYLMGDDIIIDHERLSATRRRREPCEVDE